MSKVQAENYIVIQGWMLTDLNLKGNELIIYAIIYGFSQSGEGQRYTGSLQYLADWTNSTKQGVMKNLKSLIEKELIGKDEKVINGVKFCEYYATKFNTLLNKVEQGMQQSLIPPIKQSLPNNIDNNNLYYNQDYNIENPSPPPTKPKKEKPEKHKRGEYQHVLLSDAEEDKLIEEYGMTVMLKAITFLDEYIEMKGYKAKNHYLAIRKWVIKAVEEEEIKNRKTSNTQKNTPRFGNFDPEDVMKRAMDRTYGNDDAKLQGRIDALKERCGQ